MDLRLWYLWQGSLKVSAFEFLRCSGSSMHPCGIFILRGEFTARNYFRGYKLHFNFLALIVFHYIQYNNPYWTMMFYSESSKTFYFHRNNLLCNKWQKRWGRLPEISYESWKSISEKPIRHNRKESVECCIFFSYYIYIYIYICLCVCVCVIIVLDIHPTKWLEIWLDSVKIVYFLATFRSSSHVFFSL